MCSSMECNSPPGPFPFRWRASARGPQIALVATCLFFHGVSTAAQPAAPQPAAPQPATLSLSDALERAMSANPTIVAARLQRPIDLAAVSVAGERPNPDVLYEASKETPRQAIGGTIPIEFGGKRQRRIDVANAGAAVGEADLARVIAEVRHDVRRAYFEAVAADMRAQMADDVRALAERARDAANARVVAGDVPRSDLTLSDLALATSENDLVGARGEATAARAELNILLGQPADTPLTLSDSLSRGLLIAPQEAFALATQSNVDVQVLDRQILEQVAKVNLAKALTVPDAAAGGTFTYDAEPEFRYGWRVSGGVTVPVFTRHKAGVAVEEATLTRLKHDREALVARITGSISVALARATAARDQIGRYETSILPLALEAERQAQAAYSGGQISLPALVQSLVISRESRQRGLQAGLDYQHALTDLDRAIGASIK
jgi:outer membrane protein, heavy metal efflux system